MAWKFKTYVSTTGRHEVQEIINGLDDIVLMSFSVCLRYLANNPRDQWGDKLKKLQGVSGIYEIRFKAKNTQQRALGFFGPKDKEFTITIWATHKQDIYKPADAIRSADKRRSKIIEGTASCVDLQIDGEDFPPAEV